MILDKNTYYIFTDGSSSKKRKSIGSAFLILDSDKKIICKKAFGFYDDKARIGIAELIAIYSALIEIDRMSLPYGTNIILYSDSQYCVNELNIWFKNQLLKNFYNVKNKETIIYVLYFLYFLREECSLNIKLEWVKGHQNNSSFEAKGNSLADELATECHKEGKILKNNIKDLTCKIDEFINRENCLNLIKSIVYDKK